LSCVNNSHLFRYLTQKFRHIGPTKNMRNVEHNFSCGRKNHNSDNDPILKTVFGLHQLLLTMFGHCFKVMLIMVALCNRADHYIFAL